MSDQKEEKCTCGRPIATESENKAAHDAKRCVFCYEFEKWAVTWNKPAEKRVEK